MGGLTNPSSLARSYDLARLFFCSYCSASVLFLYMILRKSVSKHVNTDLLTYVDTDLRRHVFSACQVCKNVCVFRM